MNQTPAYPDPSEIAAAAEKVRKKNKKASRLLSIIGALFGASLIALTIILMAAYAEPPDPREHLSWLSGTVQLVFLIPCAIMTITFLSLCIPSLVVSFRSNPPESKFIWRMRVLIAVVLLGAFIPGMIVCGNLRKQPYREKTFTYEGATFTYYASKTTSGKKYVTIIGLEEGTDVPERLALPSEIRDVPVRSIKEGAFKDLTEIKEVVLPDTIGIIPAYAFSGCTSLEEVTLPVQVSSIGEYAFKGCASLRRINEPEDSPNYKGEYSPCSVAATAFSGCPLAPEWTHEYRKE